jgi:hypothetical protein
MTPEARLDRLERIATLFVRAGLRYRRDLRELGEKINIMVNTQMQNDERFARNEERFTRSEERFTRSEERFTRSEERFVKHEERFVRVEERLAKLSEKTDRRFVELAKAQAVSDRKFTELMDILRKDRNGNSSKTNN